MPCSKKLILLLSLVFAFAALASGIKDPELEKDPFKKLRECEGRCLERGEREESPCHRQCHERFVEEMKERRGGGGEGRERERERERGGEGTSPRYEGSEVWNPQDPFKTLRECEGRCVEKGEEREQSQCHRQCLERFAEEMRSRREGREETSPGYEGGEAWNPQDPFKTMRECEGKCLEKGDERERSQCYRQCFERFEEEMRGRHGGGGGEGRKKNPRWDPQEEERRFRECQERCRSQSKREKCERRCEKEHREREKGRGRDDITERYEVWNPKDPFKKLRECEGKCGEKGDEQQRSQCHRECLERFAEEQRGSGRGKREDNPFPPQEEETKFKECRKDCRRQSEKRDVRERCERKCEKEHRERQREREEEDNPTYEKGEEEQTERQQEGKPYIFQDQHFSAKLQTDHGSIRILQRFNEKSELLRGIENYRVAIFEANPQTFIVPNHWDAETVLFVNQGRATISLIRQDKRESFNIRRGDLLRVQAGITVYMVNSDKNEKLVMVQLVHPVSTPGHFEAFFGPGGENPESFFKAFSSELLEAAFNTKRDTFERVFRQQKGGVIIKASEEQIRSMSRHEEGGIWPFSSESKGPLNLFKQRPSQSNQHGQLYEVDPSESRELRELNLEVVFANITQGSMTAPMYNSRATKIAIVVNGEGYLEIACPHVSKSESSQERQHGGGEERQKGQGSRGSQRQSTPSYQRVSSNLRCGSVFVVPAGHPFITVASKNQNLQLLCFDVKAQNNERFQLAGRRNIFKQFEREAKELAFGVSEREVNDVFNKQDEEFFLPGPRQQHGGRAYI